MAVYTPIWWANAVGDHARADRAPPWSNTPLKAMLAHTCLPEHVQNMLTFWFFNSTSTGDIVADNYSAWTSKAHMFSNTIARHYSNTPLLGALDQGA